MNKVQCLSCGEFDVEMQVTQGKAGICKSCWFKHIDNESKVEKLELENYYLQVIIGLYKEFIKAYFCL